MGGKRKKNLIHAWQLALILLPLSFIVATLLRIDHIKMTELRTEVLAADEAEDDERLSAALEKLKDFTFSHIVVNVVESNGNQEITFGTGVFYLEHQYLRAASKALAEAESQFSSDSNPNGNIYLAASNTCKPQAAANGWSWNSQGYINCMTSEIAKYPTSDSLEDTIVANIPSTELYRYNYASPVWAPTISGLIILIWLIILLIVIIKFILWLVLRLSLIFLKN